MKGLPEKAKLVFKGQIFDTYQWEQEQFDGSKAIYEKIKRKNTAVIIPVVGDKILISEEEQPGTGVYVTLPGGRVEDNEDMLVAAKRELMEETGYESYDWELYLSFRPSDKIDWIINFYIARNCVLKHSQHMDPGEKISLKFINFEEFIMLSEDSTFRDSELVTEFLRMRLHPERKEAFKNLLFKK